MMKLRKDCAIAAVLMLALVSAFALYRLAWGWSAGGSASDVPLADVSYVLGDDIEAYDSFMMSGGPPPDGIPAIDEPVFVDASSTGLRPGDMVIGFYHNGEARAYPQRIMVHHEIVNDRVGGLNVAVTYCPLTATAQGFERGEATLGVSGQLLNSNLVLFDRPTRTYFSQINATGLRGEHRGRTLVEVNLIWTTWGHWRSVYPETKVLSERTGYLRNYSRDLYGSYNPVGGYYVRDGTMFPVMHSSNRYHSKEMVVGARTADRSVYFVLSELTRDRVQSTPSFVAVYDPDLDTGFVYRSNGEDLDVRPLENGLYEFQGETYRASDLPLDQLVSVEAFFFAWHAFYPNSESV